MSQTMSVLEPRKGWHSGERAVHDKLGDQIPRSIASTGWSWHHYGLQPRHRAFNSTSLNFVPLTTLDADGRPWVSLVSRRDGAKGFVSSPDAMTLVMDVELVTDDPLEENLALCVGSGEGVLVAGLGIEPVTRDRNKFAGSMKAQKLTGAGHYRLKLAVNQSIGNCPKYIVSRELQPCPDSEPSTAYRVPRLEADNRLPEDVIALIHASDTAFLGTTYRASANEADFTPSHLGCNHRGGRAGFIRVRNDGRTLVMPDYSGNWLMTSLGNIEATPLAGLTFMSFVTGDIVYLTGQASNLFGADARAIMPLQDRITTVAVSGYIHIRGALPVREPTGTPGTMSPYSPPIRMLAEEPGALAADDARTPLAQLVSVRLHSPTLATFTFEADAPVIVRPGQAAVLDFSALVGRAAWSHMREEDPRGLNDDRVRTWTVSQAGAWAPEGTTRFALTMREKTGGVVTGALFALVRKMQEARPALMDDARELGVSPKLLGMGGEFVPRGGREMLWVAGGIGLTPFLAMLASYCTAESVPRRIQLVLTTREPQVLLPLIWAACTEGGILPPMMHIMLDVFSSCEMPVDGTYTPNGMANVTVHRHRGRLPEDFFDRVEVDKDVAEVFLCGPMEFENEMVRALARGGIQAERVNRENFKY